jgi:hypothetical protein
MVQAERVTSWDEARRKTTRVYWLDTPKTGSGGASDPPAPVVRISCIYGTLSCKTPAMVTADDPRN